MERFMRQHYRKMTEENDRKVKRALRMQNMDPQSRFYGGFPDEEDLFDAKYTIHLLASMTASYSNEDSVYYQEEQVADRVLTGLDFVERYQHEDGLFDLINCNFHSAPDTAFNLKGMMPCLHYLRKQERDEKQERIYEKLSAIAGRAAEGLLNGGFHTPNHRWAIASSLVECADFFGKPVYAEAAQAYLVEGIDCNEDGEYAEKSAGGYNMVNNNAMITLGVYTGEESYFDHVERNLWMMLTYMEPDGTIFTSNSTRQDNGKRVYPGGYYWEYLFLGKRRGIPEFVAFAKHIFDLTEANGLPAPDCLLNYMNHPELIDFESDAVWKEQDYRKLYEESGIARIKRGDFTYTLMKGKSNFLYFSNRSIDVALKIGGCVCEHRAFVPETLTETEDGFELTQVMRGWYYLPFREAQDTSDWWKMDHSKREKKLGPDLKIQVRVHDAEDGIRIDFRLHGIENAPFRIEAAVQGADRAENPWFSIQGLKNRLVVAKDGMTRFENAEDALEIGPGFGTHSYTAGKFGSEARDENCFTLYFTDYTEFDRTITIRNIG